MAIRKCDIKEILRMDRDTLNSQESEEIEFKEQFNLAGLADYLKDFAAFANNRGGYLIFGVKDSPRVLEGLNSKSIKHFQKVDPEKITAFLLELFSPNIRWEQRGVEIDGNVYGIFKIEKALTKPVIAKKDAESIKNGEIYYRYSGRTQKIQYAELEAIIQGRIQENINQWMDLMSKIAKIGPQNVALLDTEKRSLETSDNTILTIDEELFKKIKFLNEKKFSTNDETETLKIVGDVVSTVEVVKKEKENLLSEYPLSALEVVEAVKEQLSDIGPNMVWETIKNNDMKNNREYSVYNFRSRKQEELYKESGKLPAVTPSIYNYKAVDFIVNTLKNRNSTLQANNRDL